MTTEQTVTLTIPATSARLAADELYSAVRQAMDNGEPHIAEALKHAADALHAAGWEHIR